MTYLQQNKTARAQFRAPRRAKPTGLVVVHTAENVMDTIGPDTGAENVAAFICRRTDPGSYHDLVDSDSAIHLVDYAHEAYQDGTGSNPYALSLSFALKASDWTRLPAKKRDAFLTQGARAFGRQQAWLAANDYPTTPLRRISRAQSAAGMAGFISHAERDPARRKDPGASFPWSRFFAIAADLAAPTPAPTGRKVPVMVVLDPTDSHDMWLDDGKRLMHIQDSATLAGYQAAVPTVSCTKAWVDARRAELSR